MSQRFLNAYRRRLADLRARSGSSNEGIVSDAFRYLLETWGKSDDLMLVPQWEATGPRGNNIRIDGALVPAALRVPFGYWEAKDDNDDIDKEIADKRRKGYPTDNILYENTKVAVLIQNNVEIDRVPLEGDDTALLKLLERFFAYQRPEIAAFKAAATQFYADLPDILKALRDSIAKAEAANPTYRSAASKFLEHARQAINPSITPDDVREMLIQHILTEEIFTTVFDNSTYHRENNVAQRLSELEREFFTGDLKYQTNQRLRPYYSAIKGAAADLPGIREKQTFLKSLYEGFYKVYNPNAADRLGVVYTPAEIVRFMIRGTDWLCEKHFGKTLADPGVEILDPATGTGTFIVELLDYMSGDRDKLRRKYKEELHANEVAILPYYVANLNIEATYAALTGQYAEFPGLVFVDTLDNTASISAVKGGTHYGDLLGSVSDENLERVKRQNERQISIVIGNPPYNANQINEKDDNKNRAYRIIDEAIRRTYIARSSAKKAKVFDMYVRFIRWATDRIHENGIVSFVCNRNLIDKLGFDGFRRTVSSEFCNIYIVDLGGDVRANPQLSGTTHNVFGIQTGVCIIFLVRKGKSDSCKIEHSGRPELETAEDKLAFLSQTDLQEVDFRSLRQSEDGSWLHTATDGWESLLPVASQGTKDTSVEGQEAAIFKIFSLGIATNKDEWAYGVGYDEIKNKIAFFAKEFNRIREKPGVKSESELIKIGSEVLAKIGSLERMEPDRVIVRTSNFRPFVKRYIAYDRRIVHRLYAMPLLNSAKDEPENQTICFHGLAAEQPFATYASLGPFDLGYLKTGNGGTFGVGRFRLLPSGVKEDNVTEWAVQQFRTHYGPEAEITKDRIFAYCYAALHDPVWRETYAADLRRSFPRIPLNPGFDQWADWGEALLKLHIDYETVEPFALKRIDKPAPKRPEGVAPKPKLKSHADKGAIEIDEDTQIAGVPPEAWAYKLGNRSAIDWVLDQHKEKTPRDPTIREKFNTYRFADHKESCITLLQRVVTVSLETLKIVDAIRNAPR
jgi:predicted helicase